MAVGGEAPDPPDPIVRQAGRRHQPRRGTGRRGPPSSAMTAVFELVDRD
jgi:hypothetical protein